MKLACLKSERDGRLVVVNKAMSRYVSVTEIAPTLQKHWITGAPVGPVCEKSIKHLKKIKFLPKHMIQPPALHLYQEHFNG